MKIVTRTCLASREVKNRDEMIRIVKTPQGLVVIDKNGNLPGRGCYISPDAKCIATARKKNLINKALRTSVNEEIYDELEKLIK